MALPLYTFNVRKYFLKKERKKKKRKKERQGPGSRGCDVGGREARAKRRRRRPPFRGRGRESSRRLTNPRELKGGKERKKKARDVIAPLVLFFHLCPCDIGTEQKRSLQSLRTGGEACVWNICPRFSGSIGEYWRDGEAFRIVRCQLLCGDCLSRSARPSPFSLVSLSRSPLPTLPSPPRLLLS